MKTFSRLIVLGAALLLAMPALPPQVAAQLQAGGEVAGVMPSLKPEGMIPDFRTPLRYATITLSWNLASKPDALLGRPARVAEMAALQEFLAEHLQHVPLPSIGGAELADMRAVRGRFRSALGIRPDAPPRQAVATLWALSRALEAGDEARVAALLNSDLFVADAAAIRERLGNFVVPAEVSHAIQRVEDAVFREDRESDDCPRCP